MCADRARHRCEYCQLPQSASRLRHQIDHIIARQHGGGDALSNLETRVSGYNWPRPLTNGR